MATPSKSRNFRRAVAAAELALLLPVLTMLLVLGIDFGRVFYYYVTITNCARNGALYAADPTAPSQSAYGSMSAAARKLTESSWAAKIGAMPNTSR